MDLNRKIYLPIMIVIFLIMGIEIIILTYQNRYLNSILKDRRIKMNIGLRVGDKIANLNNFFEGKLTYKISNNSEQKLLLIFFSQDCHACLMDISNWEKILDKIEGRIKLVGISLGKEKETNEFVKKNNINFDVIIDDNLSIAKNFQIRSIPAKILINMDNVIEFIQIGTGSKSSNDKLMQIISKTKRIR